MEEAGIALANHHMSIFATAHFYNAIQELTEIRWPDIDRIIDLHSGAIFANDIPTDPTDHYRRISHRTGVTGSRKHFDQKQPWKMRTGAASASLKELIESKGTVENALLQLENQIEAHVSQPESVGRRLKAQKQGRRRQLNPTQLLSRFEEYLPIVFKDMEIDYITLTKTCNALMKQMRTTLRPDLGMDLPSMTGPGDSNNHGYVLMILEILHANSEAYSVHQKKRDRTKFEGSLELQVACRVFVEFFNARLAPRQISP